MLTSPKKGETAVHGCKATLSVSVVLVFRKVNWLTDLFVSNFPLGRANANEIAKPCEKSNLDFLKKLYV